MASLSSKVVDDTEHFPQEIQDDLEEMQIFTTRLMKMRCYRCDRLLPQDFSTDKWFRSWDDRQKQNKKPSICASKCQCQSWTCVGCGKKPATGKYFADIRGYYVDWCCTRGRIFAIWMLLCRYDDFELKMLPQRQSSNNLANESQSIQQKQSTGVGYNSVYNYGYTSYDYKVLSGGMLNFTQTDAKMDSITKNFLAMITRLLPLYVQERAPSGLASMIELSLFQERAAQLLRNESIKDAQTHGSLYRYLLDFVEKIGTHKDTKFLVTDSRYVKKKSPGLERLSFGGSSISATTNPRGKHKMVQLLEVDRAQKSMSSSLVDSMKNLAIQSDALLRTARGVSSSFSDASGQEMLALAKHVSGLYKTLSVGSGKDKAQSKPTNVPAMWEAYCSERRVNYVGHDQILRNLSNAKGLRNEAASLKKSPRGRLKALTIQLTELHTSLPNGIFVIAQEDRPDIMKCLIVGPDDTPYEGGLFEFDIFCPIQFPFASPKVIFRTTYGGQVQFNPNLHRDGVVCLSILGTWHGTPAEQWQPNKSTLLQVLVSIQAMIFTSEPFYNMPREELEDRSEAFKSQSAKYIHLCQAWTVRFAMIDWLINPRMRDGMWKDFIAKYYLFNGNKILATVRMWSLLNPQIKNYRGKDQSLWTFMVGHNLLQDLESAVAAFQQKK